MNYDINYLSYLGNCTEFLSCKRKKGWIILKYCNILSIKLHEIESEGTAIKLSFLTNHDANLISNHFFLQVSASNQIDLNQWIQR